VTVLKPKNWQELSPFVLCSFLSNFNSSALYYGVSPLATDLSNCVFERHRDGVPLGVLRVRKSLSVTIHLITAVG
jgi:hypothetical protein